MNAPAEPEVRPPEVSDLVAGRGVVAAVPFGGRARPDGVIVAGWDGEAPLAVAHDDDELLGALGRATARPERVVVLESGQRDLRRLLRLGIDVARPACRFTLETLLRLDAGEPRADEVRPAASAGDARDRAWSLLAGLEKLLDQVGAARLRPLARLECMVLRPFAALEERGLPIDEPRWRSLVAEAEARAAEAKGAMLDALGDAVPRDLFGEPDVNFEHDQAVKEVLERALGRALDDVSRMTLRQIDHPAMEPLLAYREATKIVSTYGAAFLEHVRPEPGHPGRGRIHATFVPLGASTGRVASREPNLQNLPSGERFHACLCAPEGRQLITADYATCELRILAEMSGDEAFVDAFDAGEDLHSVVAARMFQQPVSKTENPELRARAKAINFGLVYGMGAAALGQQVGVEVAEAEALLETYFERFPRVRAWLQDSVEQALARGYAETLLGRRLRFDAASLDDRERRSQLSRLARNMPIQGTSADMTKLAMIRVHERLAGFDDAGLVNTIHDELVVEARADQAEAVAEAVREEMEEAHRTLVRRVPPLVEVHVGAHWAH